MRIFEQLKNKKSLISIVIVFIFVFNSFSLYNNLQPVKNSIPTQTFQSLTYFDPIRFENYYQNDYFNHSIYLMNGYDYLTKNYTIVKVDLSNDYESVISSQSISILQTKPNNTNFALVDFTTNGINSFVAEDWGTTTNNVTYNITGPRIYELYQSLNNSYLIKSQINFTCTIPAEISNVTKSCDVESIKLAGNFLTILKGLYTIKNGYYYSIQTISLKTNQSISDYVLPSTFTYDYLGKYNENEILVFYYINSNAIINIPEFNSAPSVGYLIYDINSHNIKPFIGIPSQVKENTIQGLSTFGIPTIIGNTSIEFFESRTTHHLINYALFKIEPSFSIGDINLNIGIYLIIVLVVIFVYKFDFFRRIWSYLGNI